MIDRRRIMTPSAHNGNIRRAQPGAWWQMIHQERLIYHPSLAGRERRYFYLRDYTLVLSSLTRRRTRSRGKDVCAEHKVCVCVRVCVYASFSIL